MTTDIELLSYSTGCSRIYGITVTIKLGSDVYHLTATPCFARKDIIWLIDECQAHGYEYTIKTDSGSRLVLSYEEFAALTVILNRYLSNPLYSTEREPYAD